jgi:transketolase
MGCEQTWHRLKLPKSTGLTVRSVPAGYADTSSQCCTISERPSGGSLPAVEIVTALASGRVALPAGRSGWSGRDRFIYPGRRGAVRRWRRRGVLPIAELRVRRIDSRLQGHPVVGITPGIEAATGSLGQGLSIGLGMAWAARKTGRDFRVYVLLGDGECQEGQVWEAALAAGHHQLPNLVAIVDYNKFQLDGAISDIMDLEPFAAKWQAMGWHTREIDGHDLEQVLAAFEWAQMAGGPACIIAHTIKGKGAVMEGQITMG